MEEGNAIARYLRERTVLSLCWGSLVSVKPGHNQRCWGRCSDSQSWCRFTAVHELQWKLWQHLLLTMNVLISGFHEESLFYLWHLSFVNELITGIPCPLSEGNPCTLHTRSTVTHTPPQMYTLEQCCAHCSLHSLKQFLNNHAASFQLDPVSGWI